MSVVLEEERDFKRAQILTLILALTFIIIILVALWFSLNVPPAQNVTEPTPPHMTPFGKG